MVLNLNYFSTTAPAALASAMSGGDTAVTLVDGSSFPNPATPGVGNYTVIIGFGSTREEVCTVTAKPSTDVLTVTRAQDDTSATAKNIGDVVVHGVSAREFREIAGKVDRAGDTMTGSLVLDADPTVDLGAATKQYVDTGMPIGAVIDFAGSSAPTGWHVCDGTAHGSAALESVIGSANAPDLRGKFVMAESGTYARGTTGGAATVTLTGAESGEKGHGHAGSTITVNSGNASHSHSVTGTAATGGSHDHDLSEVTGKEAAGSADLPGNGIVLITNGEDEGAGGAPLTVLSDGSHSHSVTGTAATASAAHTHTGSTSISSVAASNATSAHENLPPYYVMIKIIKTV